MKQTSDPDKIQSELLNILVAGRDTTAGLLTNVWFLLARHRRVHARLTEEIAAHVSPGEPPTYEQINAMKYLRAVLNEALRLYPIVPANTREALMDTVLPRGGVPDGESPIFVAKGQVVSYWVWAMHRREDLYGDDADQFRPERWLDEDGRKGIRPGWDFLPFNGGPRICIGREWTRISESSPSLTHQCRAVRNDGGVVCHHTSDAGVPSARISGHGALEGVSDDHLFIFERLQGSFDGPGLNVDVQWW